MLELIGKIRQDSPFLHEAIALADSIDVRGAYEDSMRQPIPRVVPLWVTRCYLCSFPPGHPLHEASVLVSVAAYGVPDKQAAFRSLAHKDEPDRVVRSFASRAIPWTCRSLASGQLTRVEWTSTTTRYFPVDTSISKGNEGAEHGQDSAPLGERRKTNAKDEVGQLNARVRAHH